MATLPDFTHLDDCYDLVYITMDDRLDMLVLAYPQPYPTIYIYSSWCGLKNDPLEKEG